MEVAALERWIELTERVFLGNSLRAWVFALCFSVLVYFCQALLRMLWLRRAPRMARIGRLDVGKLVRSVVEATRAWFMFAVAVWVGVRFLNVPAGALSLIHKSFVLCVLFQGGIWSGGVIRSLLDLFADAEEGVERAATLTAASGLLRFFVWVALLLFALDNMGVNVTTLVAGLGIGGVAIGLASQNILSDLFSSLSIILDKPFVPGDSIQVDADQGTIERIGLKTTRVRSLRGEEISFPNANLLQSRIHNFRRMAERRVVLSFGVTYQTSPDTLEAIPSIVQGLIDKQPNARFDRAHFKTYGPSSLDFEVVYWSLSQDYRVFMDVQQKVNFALFREFAARKIDFAYPTQTIFVSKES